MKNLAGFIFPHTTWRETRRVLDFATRHGAKPGGFWTSPHDIARNPAGFGLCHATWHETRRVLDFATRHSAKPGGFWTLPHDIARNPAGFSHCHTTWPKTRRVFHIATRLSETRRVLLTPKSKSTLRGGGNHAQHRIERQPRVLFSPPHSADPKNAPPNRPRQALAGEKGRGFLPTFAPQNQTNRPGNPPLNRAHSGPLF